MKIIIATTAVNIRVGESVKRYQPTLKTLADTAGATRDTMHTVPENLIRKDTHLYDIFQFMRNKRFSSADMNRIMTKCIRIREAYKSAGWAYDSDWPFFSEIVLDTLKNEGAQPTYQFLTDHLKQTMAAVSAGLSVAPAPSRKPKTVRRKVGIKMRTRRTESV